MTSEDSPSTAFEQGAEETKQAKISPFIRHTIGCPLCEATDYQYRVKSHLVVARGRDIDLRPTDYFWTVKGFDTCHPPLYFIWTCPSCLFSSAHNSYSEPFKGAVMGVDKIRSRFQTASTTVPAAVETISFLSAKGFAIGEMDHLLALKQHLLAAYCLLILPEVAESESLALGRYFLRTAWLYRDIDESPELRKAFAFSIQDMATTLKKFTDCLVFDERSALQTAAHWYATGLEKSYAIESSRDEIETLLLISRLYMKLVDLNKARHYLELAKAKARKSREELELAIRKMDLGEQEENEENNRAKLRSEIRRINTSVENARVSYEDVQEDFETEQYKRANLLLKNARTQDLESVKKLLLSNGVAEHIVKRVVASHFKKEKKGLFGIFK